jgi:DNA-binding NarL/FixJ family response regulator
MKKILILEDSPTYLFLIEQEIYRFIGQNIVFIKGCLDPDIFMEEVVLSEFDLIILDIDLPKYNGFEVIRKLKLKNVQSKIIVFSACLPNSSLSVTASFPDVLFLNKPDLSLLLVEISKFLNVEVKKSGFTRLEIAELKLLELICNDLNEDEICEKLCISSSSYHKRKAALAKKLNVPNRLISLLRFALINGYYNLKKSH